MQHENEKRMVIHFFFYPGSYYNWVETLDCAAASHEAKRYLL